MKLSRHQQSLLPSAGWEKVADRPDEGLVRHRDSRTEALIRPPGTFSHRVPRREKGKSEA
jgi:hypothetical protein